MRKNESLCIADGNIKWRSCPTKQCGWLSQKQAILVGIWHNISGANWEAVIQYPGVGFNSWLCFKFQIPVNAHVLKCMPPSAQPNSSCYGHLKSEWTLGTTLSFILFDFLIHKLINFKIRRCSTTTWCRNSALQHVSKANKAQMLKTYLQFHV